MREAMSSRRWSIVVGILLLGALVRGLHMTERSFWIDEGFSFFFALAPDLMATLARDVHPPLYFAGLRLWSEIAGDSELALRWFSLLPSMCSLAFVYQMAIEAGRWRKSKWGGSAPPPPPPGAGAAGRRCVPHTYRAEPPHNPSARRPRP
ncbi:MAG: hypothetical protein OXG85_09900, partial [Chloroflexi bacterium]|nr:hypothetical protein [Chloroflexota bacterium]